MNAFMKENKARQLLQGPTFYFAASTIYRAIAIKYFVEVKDIASHGRKKGPKATAEDHDSALSSSLVARCYTGRVLVSFLSSADWVLFHIKSITCKLLYRYNEIFLNQKNGTVLKWATAVYISASAWIY